MSAHVTIIAEAGVNHNGDQKLALDLVDAAADAGADMVKFQTWKSELVISRHAAKAAYQRETTDADESMLDMVRKLELDRDSHFKVQARAKERGLEFLSTPFDLPSIDFLVNDMKLARLKIPSGEITNGPYLLRVARSGRPVILSTGMSTEDDVRTALGVLAFGFVGAEAPPTADAFAAAYESDAGRKALSENVTVLHCTSEYPTPYADVNLRAMERLAEAFGLPVGLSDHTPGIAIATAATAMGAVMIEKHFTLDRSLPGPDHRASLEPDELTDLVENVRAVELAMGAREKKPVAGEADVARVARKSLIAACDIRKGEKFTEENLTVKRPGTGVSPMHYWEWLGRTAERDYSEDSVIE